MDEELKEKNSSAEEVPASSGNDMEITHDSAAEEAVPAEEFDPDGLIRDDKRAMIVGAILGIAIGVLMFLVPSRILEEGARLTISVILILLGPRLMQDKYHLDFRKGRYAMAAALVLVLIIYIAIGHPVN